MSETRLHLFGREQRRLQYPIGLFGVLQCDDIAVLRGRGWVGTDLLKIHIRDLDLDQTQILLGKGNDRQEVKLILEDNDPQTGEFRIHEGL